MLPYSIPYTQTKKETRVSKLANYIQVGYLLHTIGAVSVLFCIVFFQYAQEEITPNDPLAYVFFMWLSSFFLMNTLFSQLDARSRYQNFKQVRDQLFQHGYQNRMIKPLAKSNCQRLAALVAAKQLGYKQEVKLFYRKMGYRWFHVLPDFLRQYPAFVFHPYFWTSTFFLKRYKSKFF